jgi:hypothetical protein
MRTGGEGTVGGLPPRLAAAVSFVVDRVRADVGPVAGLPPATVVAVRLDPSWADPAAGETAAGETAEDLVATVFAGRHEFPLGLEDGVEYACWNLANQVQDDLVGELSRPWPELVDPSGATLGVLEPTLVGGLAGWALRGRPFCAIGQLTATVGAAGLAVT